jgi:hypothetical protein
MMYLPCHHACASAVQLQWLLDALLDPKAAPAAAKDAFKCMLRHLSAPAPDPAAVNHLQCLLRLEHEVCGLLLQLPLSTEDKQKYRRLMRQLATLWVPAGHPKHHKVMTLQADHKVRN